MGRAPRAIAKRQPCSSPNTITRDLIQELQLPMRSLVWLMALGTTECKLTGSFLMIKRIVLPEKPTNLENKGQGLLSSQCFPPLKLASVGGDAPLMLLFWGAQSKKDKEGSSRWQNQSSQNTSLGPLPSLTGQACGPCYGSVTRECFSSSPLFSCMGFVFLAI